MPKSCSRWWFANWPRTGVPVTVACRVLRVSTSGFYEWLRRRPSERDLGRAYLMDATCQGPRRLYGTYGHRRVHAELTMGRRLEVSHGRVERLIRHTGLQGVHRRRLCGCTRRDAAPTPSDDLVERNLTPTVPDRLYPDTGRRCHPTARAGAGSYLAVVVDCLTAGSWAVDRRPHPFRTRSMRCRWRSDTGAQSPERFTTATTAASTPARHSGTSFARPGCSDRWARPRLLSTTRSRRASSRPCTPSCSTGRPDPPARALPTRSPRSSRASTNPPDHTRPLATSAPPTTRPSTP